MRILCKFWGFEVYCCIICVYMNGEENFVKAGEDNKEILKVRVLVENSECRDCAGEHGLSLFIERNGQRILLDAGKSALFAENAMQLGIDLESADFAVLSHSHYDHADGFETFFEKNHHAKLYIREECGEIYFSRHGEEFKYIGPKQGMLARHKDRIIYVNEDHYTIPHTDVFLVPHNSEKLSVIGEKARLYKEENGEMVPDDFSHEQSLVIRTVKGLVVFNSCSHGGPANILREVLQCEPGNKIYAYIGGLHLSKYSDADVSDFAKVLKGLAVERIITGHCTGDRACEILREELGEKLEVMHSGMVIEL